MYYKVRTKGRWYNGGQNKRTVGNWVKRMEGDILRSKEEDIGDKVEVNRNKVDV